jgi:hypothetical protein
VFLQIQRHEKMSLILDVSVFELAVVSNRGVVEQPYYCYPESQILNLDGSLIIGVAPPRSI